MLTKPGDIVAYQAHGGNRRICRVLTSYEDIKNGQPGFDGVLTPDSPEFQQDGDWNDVWGYDDQIVAINQEVHPRLR